MPIIKSSTVSRRKSLRSARSSSSLASQSTYTKSQAGNSNRSFPATQNPDLHPCPDDSVTIKALLKQYKKLEIALSKFNSKHNPVTKANLLRTVLLPFLRSQPPLSTTFSPSSKIYESFCSVSTSILGKWWRSLLHSLVSQNAATSVSASDRNAYFECISRIMALPEWTASDPEAPAVFVSCLTETLDLCVRRVQASKIVPISMSAFVGKVFAYSFYNLPLVCNALLFLLNVKQSSVQRLVCRSEVPTRKDLADAKAAFPEHLRHLIAFKGVENVPKSRQSVINSVPPPKHPVKGIRDPGGSWVRSWSSSDSDIFNSFFRHYISLADQYLARADCSGEVSPNVFPGFYIIGTHISQIFEYSINRIVLNMKKPESSSNSVSQTSTSNFSPAKPRSPPRSPVGSGSPHNNPPASSPLSNSYPFRSTDTNYTCILKILKTTRDISFSSIPFANNLTRFIDLLFVNIARSTSIYDCNRNGLVLSLVHAHTNHVFDTSNIDWEFWLGSVYLMLNETHHLQIIMKSMAFLFNVWDRIPHQLCSTDSPQSVPHLKGWLTNTCESIKMNFLNWLTSTETWIKFFLHWNPIIRSYFLRLMVWRAIGINNFESTSAMITTRRSRIKLDLMYQTLSRKINSSGLDLDFAPDSPMLNRKFGILLFNQNQGYLGPEDVVTSGLAEAAPKLSDLRKMHPYEVLDEAIYSCTSLPSSPASQIATETATPSVEPKNGSLITSLSKFFKSLSTEEKANADLSIKPPKALGRTGSFGIKRNARSLTSLSNAPTILSRKSSPSSGQSYSTDSSATSDSESSMSDFIRSSNSSFSSRSSKNTQPPELFKVPPEIVRPIFKFDIVVDNEVLAFKFTQMQRANASTASGKFFMQGRCLPSSQPKAVKIPSVSIFLNSDIYNPFSISAEGYPMEEIYDDGEEEEKERFAKEIEKWCTNRASMQCLGKAINEWNATVEEFERFLFHTVEADQANYVPPIPDAGDEEGMSSRGEINEELYFQKIVPFLPIDSFTELKLLNAS